MVPFQPIHSSSPATRTRSKRGQDQLASSEQRLGLENVSGTEPVRLDCISALSYLRERRLSTSTRASANSTPMTMPPAVPASATMSVIDGPTK
jgi:hypothetical protein